MVNVMRKSLCCLSLIVLTSALRADIAPEALDKGKRATAFVEVGNTGAGSAFCIDPSGFFITNNHVVSAQGDADISLILRPGEKDQRKLKARVIRIDPALDLALLWVDKPGTLTVLHLADMSDLIETANVAAFGYPFGKDLSIAKDEYPSITVSTGHITSLRKVQGELRELQFDASINPGNSGGPVLNNKGQVIGVVVASIPGSGINFAIPVNQLNHFLDGVSVALSPSAIPAMSVREAHEFEIKIVAFRRSTADMTAELILSSGTDDHRTFPAHPVDANTFKVKAPLFPGTAGKRMLKLTVKDDQSELVCQVRDLQIQVGGKPTWLSALRKIERGEKTAVSFIDKEIRVETVSGLDQIETQMFGVTARQNFSRAESIVIASVEPPASSIAYRILVRQGGTIVGDLAGRIPLIGASGAEAALPKRADVELLLCNFDSDEIKRFNGRTGALIDDFASGSGLSRPACIVLGPDGYLYVSSSNSHTIHRFNGRTGQFVDVFVDRDRSGGLNSPSGLTFGPDGNLYVASSGSNSVKRYNGRTGAFMGDFVVASSGLEGPGCLAFGPDGNLYVGSSPRAVKRFNGRTGGYLGDFVSSNGIDAPGEFCFGTDGRFYLCSYGSGQIKRFDSQTGAFIDNFVTQEAIGTGGPVGLSFGPDGNLYASIRGGNYIRRFNGRTGEYIDTFVSGNGLNFPAFILFRPGVGSVKQSLR